MPSPAASTIRSPTLSVRKPHGSRVTSVPEPVAREHRADLGEAQAELSLIAGAIAGRPTPIAAKLLCASVPVGQHRPAVARARYSPKGLIGRVPVFTVTLFVSR